MSLKFPSNFLHLLIINFQSVRNTFTRSGNKSGQEQVMLIPFTTIQLFIKFPSRMSLYADEII